jgi:ecotin
MKWECPTMSLTPLTVDITQSRHVLACGMDGENPSCHWMKALVLLMMATCMATIPAAAETEAERNLKAFPAADEGMTRHVLMLPPHEQEDSLRVELQIGKMVNTDPYNRYFFGGVLRAVNIEGWGFTRHVLADLGPMAGTLMAVDPDVPKVDRFITLGGETQLLRYNSRLPLVVYVPKGVEVRHRIWRADPEAKPVPEG